MGRAIWNIVAMVIVMNAKHQLLDKLFEIHRQLKRELGREPTTDEISKETKIEPLIIASLMGQTKE